MPVINRAALNREYKGNIPDSYLKKTSVQGYGGGTPTSMPEKASTTTQTASNGIDWVSIGLIAAGGIVVSLLGRGQSNNNSSSQNIPNLNSKNYSFNDDDLSYE